ncbi:MAG TPA: hypothetical protein VGT02_10690, partial [Methylomirabilota bacterium]|nr:hypothetical protein [Methylomirabilota bacterium]
RRGIEMGGELGDLVAEALELVKRRIHRRISSVCCADSPPRFSRPRDGRRMRDRRAIQDFQEVESLRESEAQFVPLNRTFPAVRSRAASARAKRCHSRVENQIHRHR